MRFTYAEDAPSQAKPTPSFAQRFLTVALGIMVALATWEIGTFAIDYWHALNG